MSVHAGSGTRVGAHVRGKTGAREVVFQEGADAYVKRLYDLQREELGNGLVVCHRDGTPIQTVKRSFQSLLEFAGVPIMRDGMARTIYSLRHFYATQRLSHDTSPFLLAKQMGTSVEMLEKFCGQTVTSALAAQITKGKQRAAPAKDTSYPFE